MKPPLFNKEYNYFIKIMWQRIFFISIFIFISKSVEAQVTRIYTDYNGFWTSGLGDISPVEPDNNHHVLAFTYDNGSTTTTYSTGVNDALLTLYGISFVPHVYQALPVVNVPFPTQSSNYAQFGEMQDGIHNGTLPQTVKFPFPYSASNMPTLADLLTDGKYGLDISTGVTNIPSSLELEFEFTTIENINEIGDGIPDFLITQIANPSANNLDKIWFEDENGNLVGSIVNIQQNSVPPLANTKNDLFTASGSASSQINQGKQIRLVALEASEFDLGSGTNYQDAKKLKYKLGGSSDLAFVAFNYKLLNIVVANDDTAATNANTSVEIDVLENDFVPQSVELQDIVVVSGEEPQNGSVVVNPDNTVTYTPNNGFVGIDFFKYEICSTIGNCDEAMVMIVVGASDIAVTKTINPMSPNIGDPVTFTVTVANNGPFEAKGAHVTDLLPDGYTYISHTVTPANSYNQYSGSWSIGDMAVGQTETLIINGILNATGSYTNTAEVSSYMFDPDLSNNQASVTPLTMPSAKVTSYCVPGATLREVSVELTGTPNWTVNYTYNGVPYTVNGITSSPFVLSPTIKGEFYITSVTDGNNYTITYPTAPLPIDLSVQAFVYPCFVYVNPMIIQKLEN